MRSRDLARYDRQITRHTCGAWVLPDRLARTPHTCRPFTHGDAECYAPDMATETEMREAAERRVRLLKHIRDGVEQNWTPPTVSELAQREGISRRQAAWDLDLLEREGLIVQDTQHRPRTIRLVGYRVRVEAEPESAPAALYPEVTR